MEIINCPQRSDEWKAVRLGKPTASEFAKILTPTGKPSTQAEAYMHTLLAELMRGTADSPDVTEWMQRGIESEEQARAWYEFTNDVEVQQVGFVLQGKGVGPTGYGCSPDGLVGDSGLLEIKVPKPSTQVEYLLGGKLPTKYIPQCQGQLWVCEREWLDFVSWQPDMPLVSVRVERDEEYIRALADRMAWFMEKMEAKKTKLIELGYLENQNAH